MSAASGRAPGPVVLRQVSAERHADAELVADLARGERAALGLVWDRYSKLVRSVLFGALGPDGALEDLLQEVFLAFYRGASRIEDGAALRGYLIGVALRLAALELRRRKVRRWVGLSTTGELPELPVPPEDAEGRESLRALFQAIDQLSTRRRLAFVLRHVQGFEILEVADALGISESTARRELGAAQQQLAALAQGHPALIHYLKARALSRGGK